MASEPTRVSFSVDFNSFGLSGERDGFEVLLRACDGQVGVGRISYQLAVALAKQITEWSDGLDGVL